MTEAGTRPAPWQVLGKRTLYSSEWIGLDQWTVRLPDGTLIPVSLVCRRGTPRDGSAVLLLYGYGSYGVSIDAAFASPRLSLVDRGFIFAIAHIRGGDDMGHGWYLDGKLANSYSTSKMIFSLQHYIHQITKYMHDNVYYLGIWDDGDVWIVNPRLTDYKFSGVNPFFNIMEWDVTE